MGGVVTPEQPSDKPGSLYGQGVANELRAYITIPSLTLGYVNILGHSTLFYKGCQSLTAGIATELLL